MKIVNFADKFTQSKFECQTQKTFAMIKPDCFSKAGKIITKIEESGLCVLSLCLHQMTLENAQDFYAEHKGKPFYENLVQFIGTGTVIGMVLMGENAVKRWRELLGPTNCFVARNENPTSIRALYGTEGVRNAAHGSDSVESANREIGLFFGKFSRNVNCFYNQFTHEIAKENNSNHGSFLNEKSIINGTSNQTLKSGTLNHPCVSCIVIKPHVLKENKAGNVVDNIFAKCNDFGFKVVAMEMFNLNKDEVEEFMEVYKGVLPEYGLVVDEMKNGNLIAIMVQGDSSVVKSVRSICGPHDPQVAKVLRNGCLRAEFGKDKVKNGVHCTDLEDDGILECEFFFSIMQK